MSAAHNKQRAAEAALQFVVEDSLIGIGTGSTVNFFIDVLVAQKLRIRGAISSSNASTQRLEQYGIKIFDLNEVDHLSLYVDGADEADGQLCLIKGGGAALTREKIIAAAAARFICIVDDSKVVPVLGTFPLPIEVIPMARRYVAQQLLQLGGKPVWREGCVTDNGNSIIDVHGLRITDPVQFERTLNQITGIVTVGLFAQRRADVLVVGSDSAVRILP